MFEDVIIEIPFDASILKQKWKIEKVNTPTQVGYYQDKLFTGVKLCKLSINQTLVYTNSICKLKRGEIVDPSYFILVYNNMIVVKRVQDKCVHEVALQMSSHTILYEDDEWLKKQFPYFYLCLVKKDYYKSEINILEPDCEQVHRELFQLMTKLNQIYV